MTDKQLALETVSKQPENASLDEITEELLIMAAIRKGQADLQAGRVKSHEEVEKLVQSWPTK